MRLGDSGVFGFLGRCQNWLEEPTIDYATCANAKLQYPTYRHRYVPSLKLQARRASSPMGYRKGAKRQDTSVSL